MSCEHIKNVPRFQTKCVEHYCDFFNMSRKTLNQHIERTRIVDRSNPILGYFVYESQAMGSHHSTFKKKKQRVPILDSGKPGQLVLRYTNEGETEEEKITSLRKFKKNKDQRQAKAPSENKNKPRKLKENTRKKKKNPVTTSRCQGDAEQTSAETNEVSSWWANSVNCAATSRRRVLNRLNPYVGFLSHSSKSHRLFDPAEQFLSDFETSTGTSIDDFNNFMSDENDGF